MSNRNVVQRAFDCFGQEAGFEKHSGSWYRRTDEVILVLNLQKSQYSPSYYLNQGFWLRVLGDERFPKEEKCHIRVRLGSLLPHIAKDLEQLLDLRYEMPEEERFESLIALLRERLLPIIDLGSTLQGLRHLYEQGIFKAAGIRGPAQDLLRSVE